MYRFSRTIYRELAPRVIEDPDDPGVAKQRLLDACESNLRRLALDRRYFARPARTMFREVRGLFSLTDQTYAYRVIERCVRLAMAHLDELNELSDALPRECLAYTRKGSQCRREPLPGHDFCPSHKHLEEPTEFFDRRPQRGGEVRPGTAKGVGAAL